MFKNLTVSAKALAYEDEPKTADRPAALADNDLGRQDFGVSDAGSWDGGGGLGGGGGDDWS